MAKAKTLISTDDIENWLITEIAALRGTNPDEFDRRAAFNLYLDSNSTMALTSRLAKHLGRALSPTLFWDHPTLEKLCAHLAGGGESISRETNIREARNEPIAVVGMACRFPGEANDPHKYWEILLYGTDTLSGDFAHARRAGRLNDIYGFDADFFRISPAEAVQMDPQQRLVLELAWEGLEDAGITPSKLRGTGVGVFMGAMWNDYHRGHEELTAHSATGGDSSLISARIAYFLGLRGPALTINTACSSSLTAIHTAAGCLRSGEIHTAIAGGVSLFLSERSEQAMSRFGALSPNDRCAAFDASADGYARGEGAGLVILKPLSHALRDGDSIYCLLRGSAVNNDGPSNGLTAPSSEAQAEVIRKALASANMEPTEVQYVEAHGTGTRLGDPIEAGALGRIYGAAPRDPLRIGSVKTNLGHLEAAAGIAGFMKTALALHHRRLPPSLHFRAPNPHIDFSALRLRVQTEDSPWPRGTGTPAAGVSSFGFGGTNAHAILQAFGDSPSPREFSRSAMNAKDTAFIFSGGGHQWRGMGIQLLGVEPAFHARLARCDEIISRLADWSLLDELIRGENLHRTDIAQPVVTALQLGLADLLRERGIQPGAVLGHSGGEPAAICFAGILSEEEAMEIAFHRGRLQARAGGRGGLVHAKLEIAAAEDLVRSAPGVDIAAINGPRSVVFSGENEVLDDLIERLNTMTANPLRVRVDFAAHGPAMDALKEEFFRAIRHIRPGPGEIPLYSPLDGGLLENGECDAYYWARNLREPVRFDLGMGSLLKQGINTFIEISAHPILSPAMADSAPRALILPSMRRGESQAALLDETQRAWASRGDSAEAGDALAETKESRPHYLFALSAPDARALRERAKQSLEFIRGRRPDIVDFCRTSLLHREHQDHRWAAGVADVPELEARLEQFLNMPRDTGAVRRRESAPVFVYSGQGSEWMGMGRELFRLEPEYRRTLRLCDQIFQDYSGWSILRKLEETPGERNWADTAEVQACLFAVQTAMTSLLRNRGIEPGAVLGHSAGEIAAAHAAGILSLEDSLALINLRGRIMSRPEYRGRMLEAEISEAAAAKVLETLEGRVCVAARNRPGTLVFSGDSIAMRECRGILRQLGVRARLLRTRSAFHGPRMGALKEELRREAAFIKPEPGHTPFFSSVTAGLLSGLDLTAAYWGRNAAEPVLFEPTVGAVTKTGARSFLEISPHSVLTYSIREIAGNRDDELLVIALSRRGRSEASSFTEAMARLHGAGHSMRYSSFFPRGGKLVRGPLYPWNRKRYRLGDENAAPAEKAQPAEASSELDFYRVEWRKRDASDAGAKARIDNWLILGEESGMALEMLQVLQDRNEVARILSIADAKGLEHELANLAGATRLLIPWESLLSKENSAGTPIPEPTPLADVLRVLEKYPTDTWIITADLREPVAGNAEFADPAQSALWGLGKTLALESTGHRIRLADLTRACAKPSSQLSRMRIARLLDLMARPGGDEQFLIGARRIWTPVLTRAPAPPIEEARFHSDAVYLITGGTGGIGTLLARRLLELGAGRVILAARNEPETMEPRDARVQFIKCDVSCRAQVGRLIHECGDSLRGIFHAAGAGKILLARGKDHHPSSLDNWHGDTEAKILGVLNLHEYTRDLPLDYFACFSSAAAVWGAGGMGSYAGANAFLDAFMHARRLEGRPGLTVNFSPWKETGMASQPDGAFESDGVASADPRECLHAFFNLLVADVSHLTAARLEPGRFAALMRSRGRDTFVADIAPRKEDRPEADAPEEVESDLFRELNSIPADERREYLLSRLRETLRGMLGMPGMPLPEERGFFQLGLDSLMTVEFRNRLRREFRGALSPTLILEYPNLGALTTHLLSRFFPDVIPGESNVPRPPLEPDEIPKVLEEATRMSRREIVSALRGR